MADRRLGSIGVFFCFFVVVFRRRCFGLCPVGLCVDFSDRRRHFVDAVSFNSTLFVRQVETARAGSRRETSRPWPSASILEGQRVPGKKVSKKERETSLGLLLQHSCPPEKDEHQRKRRERAPETENPRMKERKKERKKEGKRNVRTTP